MIHNDILNQLQFLIKTTAPPLLEVQTRLADLPEWTPGQKLPAHVLSQQPNGRFAVLVQDHVLDMNLPRNTQPGQNLELTFVTNQPRPTFVLTAHVMQQQAGPQGGKVSFSEAAKYLGGLLQKLSQGQAQETAQPVKTVPLVAGAPTNVKELATALKAALSQSGLFYESHQAQWVAGERPLASLLQEPQGQLSRLARPQASHAEMPAGRVAENSQEPHPAPASRGDVPVSEKGGAGEPVHPKAQHVLQQQLAAIESRQVVWQGQVWPGQDMEWEVEERDAREQDDRGEAASWQTHLHLDLPSLGDVRAVIGLRGRQVSVEFQVVRPETAQIMKREQVRLRDSLASRGLNMQPMSVSKAEQNDGKAA